MSIGVDLGSAFVKVAEMGADGVPVPVEHPDLVPGHGIPRHGADPASALRRALQPVQPLRRRRVVVAATQPFPGVEVVEPAIAAAAWARRDGAPDPGLLLVVDLGADGCRAVLCRIEDGLVGVVERAHAEHGFGVAFDRAVLAAAQQQDEADLWRARRSVPAATVRETVAFAELRPRFADTPIFGAGPYRVAAALDAWRPLADLARYVVSQIRVDEPVSLLMAGGMADFPPALGTITEGSATVDGPAERAYTAAFGAALIAAGKVTAGDRLPHPVTLRIRQIRAGLLVTADVPLPRPAGPDGEPVYAAEAFGVGGLLTEPVLDMRADGTAWSVAVPQLLPETGTFQVGLRLREGRPELMLAPAGGGSATAHRLIRQAKGETR